jgi:hypothetical protein
MRFAKFAILAASLILAAVFLGAGLGALVPNLKYKDFEAQDIPIGIAFLAFAVAIAYFWKIEEQTITRRIITEYDPVSGILRKIEEIVESTKRILGPPGPRI